MLKLPGCEDGGAYYGEEEEFNTHQHYDDLLRRTQQHRDDLLRTQQHHHGPQRQGHHKPPKGEERFFI